jgi:hypothetical protein
VALQSFRAQESTDLSFEKVCAINSLHCLYQPRTQALSTTRLAGGKTLVQAGHFGREQLGLMGVREGKCGVRVQNNTRSE